LSRTALDKQWAYVEENLDDNGKKSENTENFVRIKKKVNGIQRNNLYDEGRDNYYQNAYENYPPGYYENSQPKYPYYSPPEGKPNSIQDKINSFDYYDDYRPGFAQEAVDPSQLLIGVGGFRSTTRIPFIKKAVILDQSTTQQMGDEHQASKNQVQGGNNNNNRRQQTISNSDGNPAQIFGDLSNLIHLSQNDDGTVSQTRPSSESNAPPERIQVLKDNDRTVITSGPGFQSISRPGGQTSVTFPVKNNFQNPTRQPTRKYRLPPRRPFYQQRPQRPQRLQRPIVQAERNTYDYYDYEEYREYDYGDYFDNEPSKPIGPMNSPNRPSNRKPFRQQSPNQISPQAPPPAPYPQYPQNPQFSQYTQYPKNPYAPQYPYYYPYPPPVNSNPASTSTSVSCNSGGCASAASATAGSSSSSSTSTTSGSGGSSGGGGSSAASGGDGGASSSTSGRSNKIPSFILADDFVEWNSFEPISETDNIQTHHAFNSDKTNGKDDPNFPKRDSVLIRSLQPRLPIPGIIQPSIKRKRRSVQGYHTKPVLKMPMYLNEIVNKDTDHAFDSYIPVINLVDDVTWKDYKHNQTRQIVNKVIPKISEEEETPEESNTMLSRLNEFMNEDLDVFLDAVESSDEPIVMYMNNRVDEIMHSVQAGMDHSVMGDFVRMMLAVPVVGVLLNLIGAPPGATAFLGMVVPMFLMQYIEPNSEGTNSHHHG